MRACLFKRGKLYHGKIKLDAWAKEKRVSLGTTDKRVASIELEKRVKDCQAVQSGQLAPLSVREAAKQGLEAHCAAFLADLDRSVGTEKKYTIALRVVKREMGWTETAQVTESAFRQWLRESELRAETCNDYLAVWRRLFRWLKRARLVLENPCEFIDPLDVHKTAREYRYSLNEEQVGRLLAVAPEPRRTIYRLMLETGLRRAELNGLRVGDILIRDTGLPAPHTPGPGEVCRAGSPEKKCGETGSEHGLCRPGAARLRVPASIAKNRKSVLLAIEDQTAAELRAIIPAEAAAFQLAFKGIVPRCTTFRKDLAAAGIPAVDTMGRRMDLHGLRKTFGTALALQRVDPIVLKEAMRHSDLKLTLKVYMDAAQLQGPVAAAVAELPWHRTGQSKAEFA